MSLTCGSLSCGSLSCGSLSLDLSRPQIMGILNTTPDSFSDGGEYYQGGQLAMDLALRRAEAMVAEGASIIDVGGESTRPGAATVSLQQELDRVVPVVEAIRQRLEVVVSVDTSSPQVMREAAQVGAGLINDVRALQRPGALDAAAATQLPVCLMHMQGDPATMQQQPAYHNVVAAVTEFLAERREACLAAGIPAEQILLDPGFGFGKTLVHNLALLRELGALQSLNCPILVGLSRKSLLGKLLGRELADRLPGSLALAMLAVQRGARIIRVHDVAATHDVLQIQAAIDDNAAG